MRIAIFIGHFPVISETFVLRQLTGLIDLGHELHIYADWPPDHAERQIWPDWPESPVHPEVDEYDLRSRTTYINMPLATGYWAHSVWPLTGKTWVHGEREPIANLGRALHAAPELVRALRASPRLTIDALNPRHYGHDARTLATLYRLARLAREEGRFDVLHAHFGWSGNNFRFASELWDVPFVVSFHGGGDLCFEPDVDPVEHYRELFGVARAVTANSEYTRESLERVGCPPERIVVIEEGLDVGSFEFRERQLGPDGMVRIVSVGRLVEMKGHEYSIRALARVRERHPNVRLDIVGEGSLRPDHERLIAELGLGDAVTLHGALPGDRVRELMDQAHLFVLASVTTSGGDSEGQGLVLQEAQAAGLPVVTTEHGPFPEGVQPERSALLAPERDADALADQICRLLDEPERWPAMGRAGREYVESRYDQAKLNERLVGVYESVAVSARQGARATA